MSERTLFRLGFVMLVLGLLISTLSLISARGAPLAPPPRGDSGCQRQLRELQRDYARLVREVVP